LAKAGKQSSFIHRLKPVAIEWLLFIEWIFFSSLQPWTIEWIFDIFFTIEAC